MRLPRQAQHLVVAGTAACILLCSAFTAWGVYRVRDILLVRELPLPKELTIMGAGYSTPIKCTKNGVTHVTTITGGTTYREHLDLVNEAVATCEETGGTTG